MSTATMSHTAEANVGLYGVMAEYQDEEQLVHAAQKMYDMGYRKLDGFSPFPVHGLADAIGRHPSKLPMLVLAGGIAGAVGGLGMMWFSSVIHYPINVAGRPYFSWPMFIPIMFECTILIAALTAVFGMLGLNNLPQPYHPTFNVPAFERASSHSFFLCVEATDSRFDVQKVREDFDTTKAQAVYEVPL